MAMDKCQRFLDKLKTPAELRKEDLDAEAVAEVATDEAVDALDMLESSQKEPNRAAVTKEGHVNFGTIGFMRMDAGEDACIDENANGDTVANDEIDEQGDIEGTSKSADVLEHLESVQDGENLDDIGNDIGNVELSDRLDLSTGVVVNVEACVDASGVNSGEKRAAENTLVQNPRKKQKTPRETRKKLIEKSTPKENEDIKNAKKRFKDNFKTIKLKVEIIQPKNGTVPDFALFIKDDLHSPEAIPPSNHAGKYLTYIKGDITKKFFSKRGIAFNMQEFFLCENALDLKEDRNLPLEMARISVSRESDESDDSTEEDVQIPVIDEENVVVDDECSDQLSKSDSNESEPNVFNMGQSARKVSWGAPMRENSGSSSSSGGVNIFGRAAEKEVSAEKKKKKADKKKRSKEASAKTTVDILDDSLHRSGCWGSSGTSRGRGSKRGRGRIPGPLPGSSGVTRGKATGTLPSTSRGTSRGRASKGRGSSKRKP